MTREEAIEMLTLADYPCTDDCPLYDTECKDCGFYQAVQMGLEALKEQRPHGEWIKDDWVRDLKGEFHRQYTCSECGYQVIKCYPFCVCGADMREGEAE